MAKVKVVKALGRIYTRREEAPRVYVTNPPRDDRPWLFACHVVFCPHNWIITARPPTTPKPKARGKKGSK